MKPSFLSVEPKLVRGNALFRYFTVKGIVNDASQINFNTIKELRMCCTIRITNNALEYSLQTKKIAFTGIPLVKLISPNHILSKELCYISLNNYKFGLKSFLTHKSI